MQCLVPYLHRTTQHRREEHLTGETPTPVWTTWGLTCQWPATWGIWNSQPSSPQGCHGDTALLAMSGF